MSTKSMTIGEAEAYRAGMRHAAAIALRKVQYAQKVGNTSAALGCKWCEVAIRADLERKS